MGYRFVLQRMVSALLSYFLRSVERTRVCGGWIYIIANYVLATPSSPFIYHTGAVFYYTLLQTTVWWLLYVLMLFWRVRFPLHIRSFGKTHWLKFVHISCVTLALLAPWIPVIAAFATGGFTNASFPPQLCTGRDSEAAFYSLMVPIMVIMQIGVSLLIVIFWTLHKVSLWHGQ